MKRLCGATTSSHRRWAAILAALLVSCGWSGAAGAQSVDLRATVEWLSGEQWQGRGNDDPRRGDLVDALAERLGALGEIGRQDFSSKEGWPLCNLYWTRKGTVATNEWVVLGAHYDHLGRGGPADPHPGVIYPGADDNASGVAVAMGVLDRLRNYPDSDRGVCVVFFAGEEIGLQGSKAFLESGPVRQGQIVAMINLDTVGRLSSDGLSVFGVASSASFGPTLAGINSAYGLPLKTVERSSGASDDAPFAAAGIPTLHLFTGAHPEYHRPGDTADLIDGDGLVVLADLTADLVDYLATSDVDLSFVPAGAANATPDPERATEGRRRVSFGSIPDFQFAGPGVKISGVLPASPAASAGLQEGDVIVAFGGEAVADLTDYSEAMKLYSPGDEVEVRFRRGGEERAVTVTLVERK